ncbi:MAG TPA: hypothetical protein VIK95_12315 [Egibacteraceae bacterium]
MRRLLSAAVVALACLALVAPAAAQPLPSRIDLPDGWQPEGVAIARGFLYSGSLAGRGIYRVDLRTGRGSVLPGTQGREAVGLAASPDGRLLFVAGGGSGTATVYDLDRGTTVATYDLTDAPATFVNDVIVTDDAAWFTDSVNQVLYRVALGRDGRPGAATTVPLTGDIAYDDGFNVNGIEATRGGDVLILVQSNTGELFAVDAATGVADEIDLGGDDVSNGDGILLRGRTLYVVENFDQEITTVTLSPDLSRGTVVARTSDPGFDIPTTIARRGAWLFAANARFTTTPAPDTEYWITVLRLP